MEYVSYLLSFNSLQVAAAAGKEDPYCSRSYFITIVFFSLGFDMRSELRCLWSLRIKQWDGIWSIDHSSQSKTITIVRLKLPHFQLSIR